MATVGSVVNMDIIVTPSPDSVVNHLCEKIKNLHKENSFLSASVEMIHAQLQDKIKECEELKLKSEIK